MKRRGFLGFLGGAAVAGPGMVKNAAAQTMADLHPSGIALSSSAGISNGPMEAVPMNDITYQAERFARWNIARLNPEWLSRKRRERWVDGLDPDIASYRSISLGSKIRMQRNRNFETWLEGQDNWFERAISGERDEF